jgi:D-beta-D-heptose 7-phosphate kinase/D-beta-D-heptose 1-phosphate adenosyltransferase
MTSMTLSVNGFRDLPVLVVGDVMLDRQVRGHVRRISPEAPVPVVSYDREDASPGGAGHVAASLAGLGCHVTLAGLVGDDPDGRRLRDELAARGVAAVFGPGDGLTTVCKTRILSEAGQQLLRLDRDGRREAFAAAAGGLLERTLPALDGRRAVVLADYDKGAVTPGLAAAVIRACRARGVPCVVDPKKPDLSAYAGATVLTPNLPEAERALGRPLPDDEAIARAAEEVRDRLGLGAMLITRGPDGMTLAAGGEPVHIPAQARAVADVTGAGDTVVAVLAACLGSGWGPADACRLAGTAAGIAVSHPGTHVVRAEELEPAWRGVSPKVVGWEAAARRVADAREAGRRVVFTNGCFDILHAGHLSCLERARALGDVLVVGLNSDASVKANKGEARPIIGQSDRSALLAGLACVDLVVVFDEQTPEALIRRLEPDVLVKGSDYAPGAIAGADFVRSRGGQVVTLPLVPGLSTTSILARRPG